MEPLKFSKNFLDFQQIFPSEAACLQYLEQLRWPVGFTCEKCGTVGEPYRIATRPRLLKCRFCLYETSVTAGTVMHRTRTPLLIWFWASYLVATQTPGISALEIQKKLGIISATKLPFSYCISYEQLWFDQIVT